MAQMKAHTEAAFEQLIAATLAQTAPTLHRRPVPEPFLYSVPPDIGIGLPTIAKIGGWDRAGILLTRIVYSDTVQWWSGRSGAGKKRR